MSFLNWTMEDVAKHQAKVKGVPTLDSIRKAHGLEPKPKRGTPNKTESEYALLLSHEFPGCKPKFEAITLHLENCHRYTPDWYILLPDRQILLIEVKNSGYQHASYGRSKMAFDQARIDFPTFLYRWASKSKTGWDVKDY